MRPQVCSLSALCKTTGAHRLTLAHAEESQRTSDWLSLYEGPFALLCFADANLSVLCSSLRDGDIRNAHL